MTVQPKGNETCECWCKCPKELEERLEIIKKICGWCLNGIH